MPEIKGDAALRLEPVRPHVPLRWRLGVFAYNTATGVVITHVSPRSPAARVGLEPGDRIVSVNGFQIGYVNHFLYPLGEELQLRADGAGRVRLLVQNVRNNQLLNLDVRLERGRFAVPPRPLLQESREDPAGGAPAVSEPRKR